MNIARDQLERCLQTQNLTTNRNIFKLKKNLCHPNEKLVILET